MPAATKASDRRTSGEKVRAAEEARDIGAALIAADEQITKGKDALRLLRSGREALVVRLIEITTGVRQQRIDEAMDGDESEGEA